MPQKATSDAVHVAVAAIAGVNCPLTQDCMRIANARELARVYRFFEDQACGQLLIADVRRQLAVRNYSL